MFDNLPQAAACRWLTWKNDSTGSSSPGEAPAFALLRPILNVSDVLQFETAEGQLVLFAGKPEVDNSGRGYLVNGPFAVKLGSYGICTLDYPCYALYDTADGTPAYGEIWGARDNDWKLRKGYLGFQIMGGHTDGRVLVRPEVTGSSSTTVTSPHGASMALVGTQTVSSAAATKLTLTEKDVTGDCTTASNAIVLSPAGKYDFWSAFSGSNAAAGINIQLRIFKNGALLSADFDAWAHSPVISYNCGGGANGTQTFADGDTLALYVLSASLSSWTIRSAQLTATHKSAN